jgi:hypothetical protein
MRGMRLYLLVFGIGALATAGGCGAKPVPVKGVVTLDNRPLANASVLFHSQESGGKDATGYTDATGAFELTTVRLKDGALPGLYKVTVQYSEPIEVSPELKTAEEVQRATTEASRSRKPTVILPEVYTRPDQTPLQHRVPDDGDVRLQLSSTPPAP